MYRHRIWNEQKYQSSFQTSPRPDKFYRKRVSNIKLSSSFPFRCRRRTRYATYSFNLCFVPLLIKMLRASYCLLLLRFLCTRISLFQFFHTFMKSWLYLYSSTNMDMHIHRYTHLNKPSARFIRFHVYMVGSRLTAKIWREYMQVANVILFVWDFNIHKIMKNKDIYFYICNVS